MNCRHAGRSREFLEEKPPFRIGSFGTFLASESRSLGAKIPIKSNVRSEGENNSFPQIFGLWKTPVASRTLERAAGIEPAFSAWEVVAQL
jgi:hypothetical protein